MRAEKTSAYIFTASKIVMAVKVSKFDSVFRLRLCGSNVGEKALLSMTTLTITYSNYRAETPC